MDLLTLLLILLGVILGVVVGYFFAHNSLTKKQDQARQSAHYIISEANKEAESLKKKSWLKLKKKINKLEIILIVKLEREEVTYKSKKQDYFKKKKI